MYIQQTNKNENAFIIEILDEYTLLTGMTKMRLRTMASRETMDGLMHHGGHALGTHGSIN